MSKRKNKDIETFFETDRAHLSINDSKGVSNKLSGAVLLLPLLSLAILTCIFSKSIAAEEFYFSSLPSKTKAVPAEAKFYIVHFAQAPKFQAALGNWYKKNRKASYTFKSVFSPAVLAQRKRRLDR